MTNAVVEGYRPPPTSPSTVFLIRGSNRGVVTMPSMQVVFSLIKDIEY
jgi:hypothetical protein